MKTLTISYLPQDRRPQFGDDKHKEYRVVQVEQSTEFVPGQYLTKAEVQDLCDVPKQWKVVAKPIKVDR